MSYHCRACPCKVTMVVDSCQRYKRLGLLSMGSVVIAGCTWGLIRNVYISYSLQQSTLQTVSSQSWSSTLPRYNQWKTKARACPVQPLQGTEDWFKGQSEEDKHLLQWFQGLCGGSYLEMGGLDGITYSNSYAYHHLYNWTGVLVEPNPTSFEQFQRNRPKDTTIHAAVCNEAQTLHWVSAPDSPAVSGIWEFSKESFRQQWWSNVPLDHAIPIQCSPLSQLLQEKAPTMTYLL
jgi:hypothetical protein